jgi:hypothetical protein
MSAIPSSVDTDSKRWLAVLGVAAAIAVVFLAYSFVSQLSRSDQSVTAPSKPAATHAEEAAARAEPDWASAAAGHTSGDLLANTTKPDPFAAKYAAEAKAAAANDPVVRQKAVHQQAEYFRNLISQGKLPKGLGNLTKEQVDEMEKNGILVN